MLKRLGWGLNQWLGLVAESPCPLCQRSSPHLFCLDCQRQVQQCQLAAPGWNRSGTLPVFAWGQYSGGLKRAIAAMKYHNQPHLATPLGLWMGQTWNQIEQGLQRAIVVPIPMHNAKQQERGFNQAELLARSFCRVVSLPLELNGLQRVRATEAQFRLSTAERQQNLKDAFSLGATFLKCPPLCPVLLLDDIYTTGATAHSAAQTLRAYGIRVRGIIVLAIATYENSNAAVYRNSSTSDIFGGFGGKEANDMS